MVERGISDMEDYYLATEVRERLNKGEECVHSSEQIRKDLGMES